MPPNDRWLPPAPCLRCTDIALATTVLGRCYLIQSCDGRYHIALPPQPASIRPHRNQTMYYYISYQGQLIIHAAIDFNIVIVHEQQGCILSIVSFKPSCCVKGSKPLTPGRYINVHGMMPIRPNWTYKLRYPYTILYQMYRHRSCDKQC